LSFVIFFIMLGFNHLVKTSTNLQEFSMSTRHLFTAAALLATTVSAQADVVSVASASTLTANTTIVDSGSSLSAGSLAALLAASNGTAELYLVRGVEGLYMVASRTISAAADAVEVDIIPAPVLADIAADVIPTNNAGGVIPDTPILIGTSPVSDAGAGPIVNADADPIVNAAEVPEPSSIALLLAGVLGAAGFTRARKQG